MKLLVLGAILVATTNCLNYNLENFPSPLTDLAAGETTTPKVTSKPGLQARSTVSGSYEKSPAMFITGLVLMSILICLSNAGGLSGAGSNIPIMLIFFEMDMPQAVPISAFVAVVATSLRFVLNFNQMHPQNAEKLSLNYDIVMLVMPSVFLGSMVGILLGNLVGSTWQTVIFGITVAWSIYTSGKKVFEILEKEKREKEKSNVTEDTSLLNQETMEAMSMEMESSA
jgi:hypothetical protein